MSVNASIVEAVNIFLSFLPLALIQRGLFITAAHALTSLLRRLFHRQFE